MTGSAKRLLAIVKADLLIRFRRPSTVVVFLLLSAVPYLWVPDPSSGRALLQSGGRRALYDSASIGMATAAIASIFIGLFGFYVISNALQRDIVSRCGYVIASTRVGSLEYLVGKLAGNIAFLVTFVAGFMATSMAMLLVRGEAPLDPLLFASQYLLLVPPSIVLVSVAAIVFESIPLLSGKLGDVAWFFVWIGTMGVGASQSVGGAPPSWLNLLDFSGFAYLLQQTREHLGTTSLSIGAATFDAAKGTFVFPGLSAKGWWMWRLGAALTPLPLLLVARLFFHRFDPARLKVKAKGGRGWVERFNSWLKPVSRRIYALVQGSGSGVSLFAAARVDALLSLTKFPLLLVAFAGIVVATLATPVTGISEGVLPVMFVLLAVAISDVATRERSNDVVALVWAAPHLRERYVTWKLASALMFALVFAAVPLAKLAMARPVQAFSAAVGLLFVIAASTALGVVSSNPKTFIVLFLTQWYIAMNEKGPDAAVDFAAFHGRTSASITAGYAVASVVFVVVAELWHRRQLAR